MRLTLRTLLAYRDGVLDAVHVSELKKKFEESATAQSISQRIESAIRNRKLLALPIDAKGFGVDPNDVATFLDGTMPLDRLPDMERQCLESNSLLAEVAASHQILSRAISANAHVSKELLDRLFQAGNTTSSSSLDHGHPGSQSGPESEASRMESARTAEPITEAPKSRVSTPHRVDSNHATPNAPYLHRLKVQSDHVADETLGAPASISDSSAEFGRPADHALSGSLRRNSGVIEDFVDTGIELDDRLGSQIPEYLLGGDKKRFSDMLTFAILLTLFLFSVWMAMGPIDRIQRLLVAEKQTSPPQNLEPIHSSAPGTTLDSPQSAELELDAAKKVEPTATLEHSPETGSDSANESAEGSSNRLPVDRDQPADHLPNDEGVSPSRTSDSNGSSPARTAEPVGPAGSVANTTWTWPAASTPDDVRILFVKGKNQPDWSMKANAEKIVIPSSDQIAIVSPSHCELTTNSTDQGSDFRWIVSGDTNLECVETSEQSPRFRLATRFAKILPSEKSRSLELDFDSGILVLHFLSSQSEACIQTRSQLPHTASAVPDALIGLGEARIAAVGGELGLEWKPRNLLHSSSSDPTHNAKVNVVFGNVVLSPFDEAVIALPKEGEATFFALQTQRSEFPWWWEEELDFRNHAGLTPMQQAMLASPSDWLNTLARFAQSENTESALEGLRAQIQLGKYDLLFGPDGIFRRSELQSELGNLLDLLRTQLRCAEDVAEFQKQLKAQVGERDVAVMELLIPKTKRELESGSDKQLVDYLSDSMIDIRALAIMHLEMITGVTHGYQASNPSAESLQAWKRSLAKKQIRLRELSVPEQPEINQ